MLLRRPKKCFLECVTRALKHEVNWQNDAIGVLDEVAGMCFECRHFVQVAIESQRARAAEVRVMTGGSDNPGAIYSSVDSGVTLDTDRRPDGQLDCDWFLGRRRQVSRGVG